MVDILQGIEQDERAMEQIAFALTRIATIMEKRFEREFPTRSPRDSTVTKLPTDLDRLRASQGSTGEQTTEEWMQLGPRERELIARSRAEAKPETPEDGSS
jgi:hypothetical protein